MTTFHGTKHDDNFNESSDTSNDTFDLFKGGNDTVIAGSGDDLMQMGASLNAGDRLDGGAGRDVVSLHGDYSAGLVFDDQTIQNIEVLRLGKGFDYDLTLANGNVTNGNSLFINGSPLGSGNTLTFDGSQILDGHLDITGGAGDDTVTFGGNFSASDRFNGGAGNDTLVLDGDYSGGYTFGAAQVSSVETLKLDDGFSYKFTTVDANVGPGATLTVDASALTGTNTLTFDGSADTNSYFNIIGGAGNDTITGGAKADIFHLETGGDDTAHGGGGNDTFYLGGAFSAGDIIDGGAGTDTLAFNGLYAALAINAANVTGIEAMSFQGAGTAYGNVIVTGDIAAGGILTVDASAASSIALDLSAATSAGYSITGSSGNDTIILSGSGANTVTGGLGADTITGGGGVDTIATTAIADSSGDFSYDILKGFNFDADKFDLAGAHAITTIGLGDGTVFAGTFDFDIMQASIGHFGAGEATIIVATGGDLFGHVFLAVDGNGDGAYEPGADYVFDITGFSGTLTTGDFI